MVAICSAAGHRDLHGAPPYHNAGSDLQAALAALNASSSSASASGPPNLHFTSPRHSTSPRRPSAARRWGAADGGLRRHGAGERVRQVLPLPPGDACRVFDLMPARVIASNLALFCFGYYNFSLMVLIFYFCLPIVAMNSTATLSALIDARFIRLVHDHAFSPPARSDMPHNTMKSTPSCLLK